jgi:hypothetical protein
VTMTRNASAASVHQMLWMSAQQNLTGYPGFGPVASSLPEGEFTPWLLALRARLNAADRDPAVPGGDGDDFAYFRVRVGERTHAVVVRKRSVPDDLGRPRSSRAHVLIGPPDDNGDPDGIDVEVALGLTACAWKDWLGVDGARLRPLPMQIVRSAGLAEVAAVRARAHLWRDARPFADLLLQVLAAPQAVSHSSPLAASRDALYRGSPVTLICGLVDVLGQAIDVPWTFATRERDSRELSDVVWLVFTQSAADHPRPSPADPWMASFAGHLATRYREGGKTAVRQFVPDGPIRSADDAVAWAHSQQLAPGVPQDTATLLRHVLAGEATEAERGYLDSADAHAELRRAAGAMSAADIVSLLGLLTPRDAEQAAALVLEEALTRWWAEDTESPLTDAVSQAAADTPASIRRTLLKVSADKVDALRAEPRDPSQPVWRQLVIRTATFDRLAGSGTAAAAAQQIPPDVLLEFICALPRDRSAAICAAAQMAWSALQHKTLDQAQRARIGQVVRAADLRPESLAVCVDVLAGGDGGKPGPGVRLAERIVIYEQILLTSPVTSWVFLGRRKKLLRQLVRRPGELDSALILAVWQRPELRRGARRQLAHELALRYLPDVRAASNRGQQK